MEVVRYINTNDQFKHQAFPQSHTEEMYSFMSSFEESESIAHPCDAVPHVLDCANADSRALRTKEMEGWFREYVEKRGNPILFKACSEFAKGSIVCLKTCSV